MTVTDELIDDHLERLERAAATLPASRRVELLAEIREHVTVALAEGETRDEAAVRTILDRLGHPEDIAREAGAVPALPAAPERPGGRRVPAFELTAVLLLLIGGIVLPVLGWVVGVVLLWSSARWTDRDKVLGTLVFPGGLAVAAGWMLMAGGTSSCSATDECASGGTSLALEGAIVLPCTIGSLITCAHLLHRAPTRR